MKKFVALSLLAAVLGGCVIRRDEVVYQPAVNPVSAADVCGMAKAGYSENMMLDMIHRNGVVRKPTADDLVAMKEAGVPDKVIAATLEAPVTEAKPATETRVVYRDRYYDYYPAVSLGFGFATGYLFGRHWRCR